MKTKVILFVAGFLLIPVLCMSAVKYHNEATGKDTLVLSCDSNDNQIVTLGIGLDVTESVLTEYTSGAFKVLASAYDSDSSSWTFQVNSSSIIITVSSATSTAGLITQVKYSYDLYLATSDTYGELVALIDSSDYLTCSLVDGCYALAYATGQPCSSEGRVDGEGVVSGLQFDAAGKQVDLSTTVYTTFYQNATDTLSIYFTDKSYYGVGRIASTTTVASNTMALYETDDSLSTSIPVRLSIIETDMLETYLNIPVMTSTEGNDLEFRTVFSTWTASGSETLIHIIKQ